MSLGQRNRHIDLLRGVSIFLVLLHHFNIAYTLNDTWLAHVFGWGAIRAVARNGNYGVTMFFVISGYLITSNSDRRWEGLGNLRAGAFYRLRAARILPCLLLVLLIVNILAAAGIVIFQNHAEDGVKVSFWVVNFASLGLWMNVLLGLHGWVNYPLGVLWSLSVEEVFYLVFPIFCLVLRRDIHLLAFWIVIVAIGPMYRMAHQGDESGYLYAYFACFDGIAIGCCAALIAKRVAVSGRVAALTQVAVVATMVWLYLFKSIGQTNVLGVTAMAIGTAWLLLCASSDRPSLSEGRYGIRATLRWLGKHSYELYLFHLVVLGILRTVFPRTSALGDSKLMLFIGYLVLSTMIAATISRFYAEPLNVKLRAFSVRPRALGLAQDS